MFYLYYYEWMNNIRWNYPDDKIAVARSLGYTSILGCVINEYWKTSSREVAEKFECSRTWATMLLRKYGFPIRGQGGPRHTLKDFTGEKHGRLFISRSTKHNGNVVTEYEIICDCGNIFRTNPYYISRGHNRCPECRTKNTLPKKEELNEEHCVYTNTA